MRASRDRRGVQHGRAVCRRSLDEAEVEKSKVSERLLDAQHEILHLKSGLEVRPRTLLCAATAHCSASYRLSVFPWTCQLGATSTVYTEEEAGLAVAYVGLWCFTRGCARGRCCVRGQLLD